MRPLCCSLLIACYLLLPSGCGRSSPSPIEPDSTTSQANERVIASPTDQIASQNTDHQTDGISELESATVRKKKGVLADEVALGDQAGDWETESFHEAIKKKLKTLGDTIETQSWTEPTNLLADDFQCSVLRPIELEQTLTETDLTVFRPSRQLAIGLTRSGWSGLTESLQQLVSPFSTTPGRDKTVHFKVYKVNLATDHADSEMYIDIDGIGQSHGVEQNMVWSCKWLPSSSDGWKLSSIRLLKFEEVHYQRSEVGKLFSDCTESVLSRNESFETHLRRGIDHWRLRIEERFGIDSVSLAGLAIGDVNGDGLDDVYFCDVGGLPNRMFEQQQDGTALDVSEMAGVDWLDRSYAALFADLDNDGDQDLIVSASVSLLLMENDGTGRFTVRTRLQPSPTAQSLTAVDYNNDGRLDLFVCSYGNGLETFADSKTPLPWHDANNGAPNTLFRNNGNWKFSDMTVELGLDVNNRRYSYAAAWDDFDNDGDQDLYVANDFGRNNLYVNNFAQTGKFRDLANELGVEDISPGMSVDWGDFDNNGKMDLYISNMFSSAGNRITFQDRFMQGSHRELIGSYQRFARGNTLFQRETKRESNDNAAQHSVFDDVSVDAGVTMGRWAWSSMFADINNDGWQDLLVANGHVSGVEPDDL